MSVASEEARVRGVRALHGLIVEQHALNASVLCEGPGLRSDALSRQDAPDGPQRRVAVHQLQIPTQLLYGVHTGLALDLDGDVASGGWP